MYSQEKQFSSLAKIISNYDRVIIDTCALMDEGFPQFMDILVGSKRYWKIGLQIIIPEECIEELKKHAKNIDWHYSDARIDAVRALAILKDAKRKHQVIQIAKRQQRKGDTFADPSILATAAVLRIHYRILVITQDKDLAYDLEGLNALGSQSGRFLATMKINAGGQLEGFPANHAKSKKSQKVDAKLEKKPVLKTEKKQAPALKDKKTADPKQIPAKKNEEKPVEVKKETKKPTKAKPKTEETKITKEKPSEAKAPENKPTDKKPAAPKKTPLEKAILADKRLNSNISNPNYPSEKKLKDIDNFIKLYDKLNDDERKQLKLTKEFLLAQKENIK